MIVCKFGGTSVGDAPAIRRLAAVITARAHEQPLVVVSALAGVTDGLLAVAHAAARGDRPGLEHGVDALVDRHNEVATQLDGTGEVRAAIEAELHQLRARLLDRPGDPTDPAHLDALIGQGELWSSRLVTAALTATGLRATLADARTFILTDERFGRARPRLDAMEQAARTAVLTLLNAGHVVVTQGFIGSAPDGRPTTLGRGGSDYTAALLGAALDAARVEIWTDVSGLMSADPRIVPGARTLAAASYEEAAELATFGAKVLHPATQMPLVQKGIPFRILNSREPDHPGTLIAPEARLERLGNSPIRSISYKKGITTLSIRAPRMLGTFGFLRKLFAVFERHEVVVDVVATSEVSVSLTIEDPDRIPTIRPELEALGELQVEEGRAIVAVVGIGLRDTPGIAARVFRATEPANVEIISQGASAINITFVVRASEGPDIVRRLHEEFFGGG
ncbi:MAG TPA: lysine-sensitive aspartokinase 3 [Gemmatimonadales bacterium]|nr:lysine-sensitive aspartokinase 3 [Gemmatimonadales bacterium]